MSTCKINKIRYDELLIHNKMGYITYHFTWLQVMSYESQSNHILRLNLIKPTKHASKRLGLVWQLGSYAKSQSISN